jgi:hypothetical protein
MRWSHSPVAQPSFPIIVPARAHWFSAAAVHPIERTALPEFFPDADADASSSSSSSSSSSMSVDLSSSSSSSSSSLPSEAAYTRHRNRIIDAYRAQPHVYLTATACRRMLVGDAFALLRLHAFLESWGLINYQARVWGKNSHPMESAQYCWIMTHLHTHMNRLFWGRKVKILFVSLKTIDHIWSPHLFLHSYYSLHLTHRPNQLPGGRGCAARHVSDGGWFIVVVVVVVGWRWWCW